MFHRRSPCRCLIWLALVACGAPAAAQLEPLPPDLDFAPPALTSVPASVPYPAAIYSPPMPASAAPAWQEWQEGAAAEAWTWQAMPEGLIWQSYLAGKKEPRLASVWNHDPRNDWMWDVTLGARVGLLRYGTSGGQGRPDGWQWDLEGAAQPRLNIQESEDVEAVDFRFGSPLTYGQGPYQTKLAIYHLSSHAGDEFLERNPTFQRINFGRNALVWGHSYFVADAARLYLEIGFAFDCEISRPWEYQFGIDYCPAGWTDSTSAPFAAINVHLREEVNFGGNLVVQAGWMWRNPFVGHAFRIGMEYYNGKSDEFEFYNQSENKLGVGLWYDF